MRKIVIEKVGPPEVMQVVEVPDPTPGPGEVLVRNHICSVAGPDVLVRSGRYRFMRPLPLTPGSESACVVEALGPGVTDVKVGDRAYLSWRALPYDNPGFYTEKMVAPAVSLFKLPDDMDLDLAGNLGAYSTSWAMLTEAPGNRKINTVLLVGGSGVYGTAQTQIAHYLGMRVITLVSSDKKAAFSKENGADHTINYKTENVLERVLALTDGKGVDLIIDHLGGPSFTDYFDMLDRWGMIVSINGVDGSPAKDTFEEGRNRAKKSISICFFAMYAFQNDPERQNKVVNAVIPLLMNGTLKPRVARVFPLEEGADSHRFLESGEALGRVFLKP